MSQQKTLVKSKPIDEQLSKLALLNQEVCGYFGLYQETVTSLKEACAQIAEPQSGPKIQ